ncbi:MAG: metallophosphoesterase [Clostridia bacterium]|nr:metallophosphoesterase [Clostridia bacterium]
MNFFTSDLHFGSNETIIFDKRPFKNSKDFEKKIIKKWNNLAKKEDIIYIVGDMVDCHLDNKDNSINKLELVKKIKAKVVLILGNNEERIMEYFFDNNFNKFKSFCISLGFLDVKVSDIVNINGTQFYLTHKPKNHKNNMLNLFGHSHKAMGLYKSFGFNIGCDLNNYELYSEQDINLLLLKKTKYWDNDQNLKLI